MLNVNNVQIVYDNVIEAVRDASLSVDEGQIVTLPVSYTHLTLPTICSV